MKNRKYIIVILIFMATTASLILAQTRRAKEEEFVRTTYSIEEMELLRATIKVCDPDGDIVDMVVDEADVPNGMELSEVYIIPPNNIPSGDPNCAECNDDPNSSWYGLDITWQPTLEQEGEYRLHVHAIDDQGGDDWVVIVINVAKKNRPPVL